MRLPSISCVIPVFNAAPVVREAIESALAQDCVAIQVIVIDDGSTDSSLEVVREYRESVDVLTGPNRGVSAARNRGIAEAAGDWLIFLDSDDLLLPGTLRMRLDVAEATRTDVVVCDWGDLIDGPDGMIGGAIKSLDLAALHADPEIACATHFWLPPAAIMYRRALVQKIGGFRTDLPIIQDARLLFDAAYHGARFAYSDHVGAIYRVNQQSLSRRDPARFWRDVLLSGKQIEALWRARGSLKADEQEALAAIYNNAARGLFAAASPEYFDAVERQHALGRPLPRHPRIAAPLARTVGLSSARRMLALIGR